jgi:hypothetical protein
MNGDYKQLGLHTKYFDNARQVLDVISPGHLNHFHDVLADRLRQYASSEGETDEQHLLSPCWCVSRRGEAVTLTVPTTDQKVSSKAAPSDDLPFPFLD